LLATPGCVDAPNYCYYRLAGIAVLARVV